MKEYLKCFQLSKSQKTLRAFQIFFEKKTTRRNKQRDGETGRERGRGAGSRRACACVLSSPSLLLLLLDIVINKYKKYT